MLQWYRKWQAQKALERLAAKYAATATQLRFSLSVARYCQGAKIRRARMRKTLSAKSAPQINPSN